MSFVSGVRGPQPDAFAFGVGSREAGKKQKREGGCLRVTGMNYFDLTY